MMKFAEICLPIIISWLFVYKMGKILYNDLSKKVAINDIIIIVICILFTVFLNLNDYGIFSGIFKIVLSYIIFCFFNKLVFKKNWSNVLIGSFIIYIYILLCEVLVAIITSMILLFTKENFEVIENTILINFIISSSAYILVKKTQKIIVPLLENYNNEKISNYVIAFLMLITVALLLYIIPIYKWKLTPEFISIMLILLGILIIGLYLLKQRHDIGKTTSMYQQVVKYSNTTNKVLEDYRMISHEHKNQLSIIKQMIPKDNIEVIEYIDSLIDKRNVKKYKWVSELNKLPSEGLKGLINYKLIEMEDKNISSIVTISKEISKVKLDRLNTIQKDHLYSICGVYLDNAIQAAEKSKTKEISIDIYKENKDLVFIIGNTYKGKIELDRIDEYGYSTKGKNHGVGLHIVKTILDEDRLFSQSRKNVDKYYIQELRIHTYLLKKKKK